MTKQEAIKKYEEELKELNKFVFSGNYHTAFMNGKRREEVEKILEELKKTC